MRAFATFVRFAPSIIPICRLAFPMSSSPTFNATEYDAVVVGSGFGGTMAARGLVAAGWRVLMLERGGWVERGPQNWRADGAFTMTPHYAPDSAYRVLQGRRWADQRLCTNVGGPSVFYGGASFRFRAGDFDAAPEIVGDSGAAWPIGLRRAGAVLLRGGAHPGRGGCGGGGPHGAAARRAVSASPRAAGGGVADDRGRRAVAGAAPVPHPPRHR